MCVCARACECLCTCLSYIVVSVLLAPKIISVEQIVYKILLNMLLEMKLVHELGTRASCIIDTSKSRGAVNREFVYTPPLVV